MRFTKYLFLILCALIPIIHAKILPTLWIPLYFTINGNFEFTKVMFFNIVVSLILLVFLYEKYFFRNLSQSEKLAQVPHNSTTIFILVFVLSMLWLSTYFSISPFTSLIWDTEKWHTALMYFNLLLLYLILRQLEVTFIKKLLYVSIISISIASLIGFKEYFMPSYDYGELTKRAVGTFWHPNYLAWIIVIIIPLTKSVKNKFLKNSLVILFTLTILLTKSFTAYIILILYYGYIISFSNREFIDSVCRLFNKKLVRVYLCLLFIWTLLFFCYVMIVFLPEKLHSFLSRFYIWKTTLLIIFSNLKNIFIGAWPETLPYYFNAFKVPELYIFENYGFTADRAHNSYLDIFYSFWLLWITFVMFLFYFLIQEIKKWLSPKVIALIIFCIFWIFHYFSIASYVLIILIITSIEKDNIYNKFGDVSNECDQKKRIWLLTLFSLISLLWAIWCLNLVQSEIALAQWNSEKSIQIFATPAALLQQWEYDSAARLEWLVSQENIKVQIINEANRQELCNTLVSEFSSAENYFFCATIFENLGKQELAKTFYTLWIWELPDLWNKNSIYWDNYFIKKTITGNRFFSKKYSNISQIVEKYWK